MIGSFSGSLLIDLVGDWFSDCFVVVVGDDICIILVGIDEVIGDVIGMLVVRCEECDAIDFDFVLHVSHFMVVLWHRRWGVGCALLSAAV